ncbi:MAG: ATP-binding protein, partial [Rhizobacter sp.]
METDAQRLEQVLKNFLSNAVKFTERGEVTLAVAQAGPGRLAFTVRDTGIGIPAAQQAAIFEPFRQADDASNRRFGGSGLGLAISRQLVEVMGGRIAVTSELGEGARFDIELTIAPSSEARSEPAALLHDVLYFEPHEASAQALAAHLERLGCRSFRCRTARELREWMTRHAGASHKPWLLAAVDADETWAFLEQSISWLEPERVIGMATTESLQADAARKRFKVPRNLIKPVLRSALVSRLGPGQGVRPPSLPIALDPRRTAKVLPNAKHVLVV